MTKEALTALFDRAGADPPSLTDEEALSLMKKILRLPLSYFPAVQEAIRQGRWRNAENPIGYIRTVAEREAIKLGFEDPAENVHLMVPRRIDPTDNDAKPLTHDSYIEYLDHIASDSMPYKRGGIWHGGAPERDDEEAVNELGEHISERERLLAKLPAEFLSRDEELEQWLDSPDPIYYPDWEAIGRAAGLDAGECEVLEFRTYGFSREKAMALEPRRAKRIQAAWRKFDRNNRMDSVFSLLRQRIPPKPDSTPTESIS